MSDTPRTDAKEEAVDVHDKYGNCYEAGALMVAAGFARGLERELAEKDAALTRCVLEFSDMAVMLRKDGRFQATVEAVDQFITSLSETAKKDSEVLRLANCADRWDGFLEQIDEMGVIVPNELRDLCQIVRTGNRKNVESN